MSNYVCPHGLLEASALARLRCAFRGRPPAKHTRVQLLEAVRGPPGRQGRKSGQAGPGGGAVALCEGLRTRTNIGGTRGRFDTLQRFGSATVIAACRQAGQGTAAGQAAAGQAAAGQAAAGQTAAGQTAAGQTAAGQTTAGQAAARTRRRPNGVLHASAEGVGTSRHVRNDVNGRLDTGQGFLTARVGVAQ